MPQHHPGFIEDDDRRRPGQLPLDAVKQVGQHRQLFTVRIRPQRFEFETGEVREREIVRFAIEQMPGIAMQRVMRQCVAQYLVLQLGMQSGQALFL